MSLAIDWRDRVDAGRRAGGELGAGRYHEVRYEQLVAEPEAPIAEVCAFLDLPFEPDMLRFFERHDEVPAKLRDNPRHARLAEPLSAGTRSWRTAMTPEDRERFEAVAGDLLTDLGYERAVPDPPARARAAAAWGRLRRQLDRARARGPGAVRRALGRR